MSVAAFERRFVIQKAVLGGLVLLGLVSVLRLLSYFWSSLTKGSDTILVGLLLLLALGYVILQALFVWFVYLRFRPRAPAPARSGLRVDVYVTACREPAPLVERALRGALIIRYPHATWLLDDGRDPELRELATRLGVGYLTRDGNQDLKAGNVNAALPRTTGDFIAIFDVDHVPDPDFLHRTLGYFADPEVGFVQARVTFSNAEDGLVARASAGTSHEYFCVSAVGKDACGGAGLMGSNAVIRRTALQSIGGYQPGLAEDLATSLALHAQGWKSAYVALSIAPGLAPADVPAFLKQQLKWSRGVFEVALESLRGRFFRLTLPQKVCYSVRFSYYLVGAGVFAGILGVTTGLFHSPFDVEGFLGALTPLLVAAVVIRAYVLMVWAREPGSRQAQWRGVSLIVSTWPMYLTALLTTVLRIPIPFLATPKGRSGRMPLWAFLPQLLATAGLGAGVGYRLLCWQEGPMPMTVAYALVLIGMHWIIPAAAIDDLALRDLGRRRPSSKTASEAAMASSRVVIVTSPEG